MSDSVSLRFLIFVLGVWEGFGGWEDDDNLEGKGGWGLTGWKGERVGRNVGKEEWGLGGGKWRARARGKGIQNVRAKKSKG